MDCNGAFLHRHSVALRLVGQVEWVCKSPLSRLRGNAYPTSECRPTEWATYCIKEATVALLVLYLLYVRGVDSLGRVFLHHLVSSITVLSLLAN